MKPYSILINRPWSDYMDSYLAHVEAANITQATALAIQEVREEDEDYEAENEYVVIGKFEGHVKWAHE